MKEVGIEITSGKGEDLLIYYVPLTYLDWVELTDQAGEIDPDPSVVRYLFGKYITRAFARIRNGDGTTTEEPIQSPVDIVGMDAAVIDKIIRHMAQKTMFNNEEEFVTLMDKLEKRGRTLIGSYDYFILLHAGMDGYLRCLDLDAQTRAQVLVTLERYTGISVKKRFSDSVTYNVPLDLMLPVDKYENWMRQQAKRGNVQMDPNRKISTPPGVQVSQEAPPTDRDAMIRASKEALAQEMAARDRLRQEKRKAFDWQRDQATIDQFERTQEKEILDRKIGPKEEPAKKTFGFPRKG